MKKSEDLRKLVEALYVLADDRLPADAGEVFTDLRKQLNTGAIRAAEPGSHGWVVNSWVQRGILLGYRLGRIEDYSVAGHWSFFDNSTFPPRMLEMTDGVRIAPGGSSIRDGAYVARGVVCMPPMYINIGAHVGTQTLVDSHVLVGACAQVGEHVHLSAGSFLASVLDSKGAMPVIIEDGVHLAGPCSVEGGVVVKRGAVLAPGTFLSPAQAVYDLVNDVIHRAPKGEPLVIPRGAVVVPGSRPASSAMARRETLQRYVPLIVRYREPKADAREVLDEALLD